MEGHLCKKGLNDLGKRIANYVSDYERELKRVKRKWKETRKSVKNIVTRCSDLDDFIYCKKCKTLEEFFTYCRYDNCKYSDCVKKKYCDKHFEYCSDCRFHFCTFHKKKKKLVYCEDCDHWSCCNCAKDHQC